jgi:hypothetical protein
MAWAGAVLGLAACSTVPTSNNAQGQRGCYTESGWLDSSEGCFAREGYPDCYLVCPDAGTRTRVGQASPSGEVR